MLKSATKLLGMYAAIEMNRFLFLNSRMQEWIIRMVLAMVLKNFLILILLSKYHIKLEGFSLQFIYY